MAHPTLRVPALHGTLTRARGAAHRCLPGVPSAKSVRPASPQEEGAKTTALRRAFQQAVVTPMEGVDALWREWELFENNLDRNLAKPLLAEYSSRHVSAKGVLREITRLRERVHASALAVPPAYAARVAEAAAGTDVSARVAPDQSAAWDDLLAYERGNPLRLEDGQEFGRMTLAYNQCLCALAHYPRVWLELHKLYADRSDAKGAREVLVRAVRAVPSCLLVHFALADYDESRGKVAAARATYDALLAQDGSSGVLTADKKTLAYIQLMRFARRSEGAESARKIFLAARKDSDVSYHVFVASAHMEYRVSKDAKVARNIFELGLRTHLKCAGYVLAYADFLAKCLNDDNNARGLFERALAASEDMSASDLRRVWNGFMEFEAQVGNMAQYNKVQARRAEAMQEAMRREGRSSVARRGGKLDGSMRTVAGAPGSAEDGLHLMLERHAFGDLRAATPLEAGITRAQCEALGISGGPAAAEGGEGMQAQAAQGSGAPGAKTPSPLSGALGMLLAHLPPPGVIMPPVPDPAVVMSVVLSKDIPVPVAGSAASRIATPDVVRAEVSARAAQQNAQQQQASQQQAAAPGGGYGVPPQGGGGNYAGYQGGGGRGDDRRGGGPPSQQDWSSSRKPGTEGGSYGGDDRRGVKRERYDNGVPEHDVFRHRRGAGTQ